MPSGKSAQREHSRSLALKAVRIAGAFRLDGRRTGISKQVMPCSRIQGKSFKYDSSNSAVHANALMPSFTVSPSSRWSHLYDSQKLRNLPRIAPQDNIFCIIPVATVTKSRSSPAGAMPIAIRVHAQVNRFREIGVSCLTVNDLIVPLLPLHCSPASIGWSPLG